MQKGNKVGELLLKIIVHAPKGKSDVQQALKSDQWFLACNHQLQNSSHSWILLQSCALLIVAMKGGRRHLDQRGLLWNTGGVASVLVAIDPPTMILALHSLSNSITRIRMYSVVLGTFTHKQLWILRLDFLLNQLSSVKGTGGSEDVIDSFNFDVRLVGSMRRKQLVTYSVTTTERDIQSSCCLSSSS